MIRAAREEDLRRMLEMSEKYYPNTYFSTLSPFNPEAVAVLLLTMIESGIALVAEEDDNVVGMICFILAPYMFDPKIVGAYEVIWWIEPEYHGKGIGKELLEHVDTVAKDMGVSYLHVAAMAASPLSVAAMYIKAGYDHTEMAFTKRI